MAAAIAHLCKSPAVGGVGFVNAVSADDFYLLLDRSQMEQSDVDAVARGTRHARFELAVFKNRDRARPILNKLPTPGLHFEPRNEASYYVYGSGLAAMEETYCDGLEWAEFFRPGPPLSQGITQSALDALDSRVDVCTTRPKLYRHVETIRNPGYYAKEGVPELRERTIMHVRYSATFPSRLVPDVADWQRNLTLPFGALPGSTYSVNADLFDAHAPVVWEFAPSGSYGRHTKFYTSKKFETVASLVGFVVAPYCWASAEIRLPRRRLDSAQVATVVYGAECAQPDCWDRAMFRDVDQLMEHVSDCANVKNLRAQVFALNCPQAD